ncbi:enoyl-CoA hydratase/isomerase family protein [Chloroflexota bacterium]
MLKFEEYSQKYPEVRMERRHGILQIITHTNGDSYQWNDRPPVYPGNYYNLLEAFNNIGSDVENKVIIWTGAGKAFSGPQAKGTPPRRTSRGWERSNWKGRHLLMGLLDIDVPIICAVNGPALRHAEMPLICDIVLAAEEATFQDSSHILRGGVPGDGVHIVYPLLMGLNRARYFLLTSQTLSAQQALEFGLVSEVLPREKLLPRAWELAEQLAQKPPLVLRHTRTLLVHSLRRQMFELLGYGLALEGLANMDDRSEGILERDFPK